MVPYHPFGRPAQSRVRAQAGVHVGRRRPDALPDGPVKVCLLGLVGIHPAGLTALLAPLQSLIPFCTKFQFC